MDEDNKIKIEELKKECLQSNSLSEVRKILFEVAKTKGNAKNVTGITQDAIAEFDRSEIIKICQNVNSNDRIETLKIMKLSNITFEDALSIFDSSHLLQATKEFGIQVTSKDLQYLFENSHSKDDKDFIQLLIEVNPSETKTITEIVLENFEGNRLIEIIRDNNLKLSPEQLQTIINQSENLEPEQEKFIRKISSLAKKNDEITSTINYKILGEKFNALENQLSIITCHPNIQEAIINLDDKQLQVFQKCLDHYSSITPDWTPVADGILKNISQYSNLIAGLSENDFMDPQRTELLTKIISEPNYFEIGDLDSYLDKRSKTCDIILENPNSEIIQNNEYLTSLSEIDKIRFAILEKNYGISLEQAQSLVKKFADDIQTLNSHTSEARHYSALIQSLSFVCNNQDIQELITQVHDSSNRVLNANLVERHLKDEYDKEYREKLYKPTESDLLSQEEIQKYLLGQDTEGISFYLAGKSTNGLFFMESHAPGAVYGDSMLDEKQYAKAWNKPKMQSQAFCTHLTSNQLLLSNIRNVEYGFYNYEKGSLRAAGYEDISSDFEHFTAFADEDEKISSMQQRIDHTRNNDESDRARTLPDGTKRQPDYIRLLKSRHIKTELAESKLQNAKIAAKQFGIPIVIVDQDECTRQENEIIRDMIEEFQIDQNPSVLSKIITRYENNRTGNMWNKIDFAIDSNPETDEFGKTIITRNEMLTSIMSVIEQCSSQKQARQLYLALETSITAEVSKFKKPGYKTLNDDGIPVVQKQPMEFAEYFGMKRDKRTEELIPETAISSYKKFMELGSKYRKTMFLEQDIGKYTINTPTQKKDKAKKHVQRDEQILQQTQEIDASQLE